mgnify:CR=1 FL=1
MADNRKYYYLKLKEDFFDTDEMKILESMRYRLILHHLALLRCRTARNFRA